MLASLFLLVFRFLMLSFLFVFASKLLHVFSFLFYPSSYCNCLFVSLPTLFSAHLIYFSLHFPGHFSPPHVSLSCFHLVTLFSDFAHICITCFHIQFSISTIFVGMALSQASLVLLSGFNPRPSRRSK